MFWLLLFFGKAPGARLLKRGTWPLHLIGAMVSSTARKKNEVTRPLSWQCCPHIGNRRRSWGLSSSPSWSVRFFTPTEGLDVAQSALPEAQYHTGVTIWSLNWECLLCSALDLLKIGPIYFYTPVDTTGVNSIFFEWRLGWRIKESPIWQRV